MQVDRQAGALCFRVTREVHGQTLVDMIVRVLHIPDESARGALRARLVTVNATVADMDTVTKVGDRVRVQIAPGQRDDLKAEEPIPWFCPLSILYEDEHVLVLDKPAPWIMYPGSRDEMQTLANAVAAYYIESGQDALVRPVHRLDRGTSGVCLFAKHTPALRLLSMDLEARLIKRTYIAVVQGRMEQRTGVVEAAMGRDRHVAGRMRVSATGRPARTRYETIARKADASVLALQLDSGRTHQIRVHMAHVGHPVLGDALYGQGHQGIDRQALHALELTFDHPYRRETVTVRAPLPHDLTHLLAFLQLDIRDWLLIKERSE